MAKFLIVSNRLPFSVSFQDETIHLSPSIGGLATGLSSVFKKPGTLWIGWPGLAEDTLSPSQKQTLTTTLKKHRTIPVFLSTDAIHLYYHGYANTTLWPICHYFVEKTLQVELEWRAYQDVNTLFFETLKPHIEPDSIIWVHDYQLMLLPALIRKHFPTVQIGYFHHIPFPSFELFRLLSTKHELLEGLLGADLIGFHTYDYVRHFLSSVGRILQLDRHLFTILKDQRRIQVDAFPMGIDVKAWTTLHHAHAPSLTTLLSVDRLDYTKGIPQRLDAFEHLLLTHPEYIGKIRLQLIVAPSRDVLESYDMLKDLIDKRVSQINASLGTMHWMPIVYLYQSFNQEQLKQWYNESMVMVVTPLRDGMNLVSKEYLIAKKDRQGVLILSETAGASGELAEALLVNPTDTHALAEAMHQALIMPKEEKMRRHKLMVQRLKRTDIHAWVKRFISQLKKANPTLTISQPRDVAIYGLKKAYKQAKKVLFLLDYDGTLTPLRASPELAKPDHNVHQLLSHLISRPHHEIAIISGRDIKNLEAWFKKYPIHLSGNHGGMIKMVNEPRTSLLETDTSWKASFLSLLYQYADQMPGSFVEEKHASIAFHYRQCEPDMVAIRLGEIIDALDAIKGKGFLHILLGHKVIEIKDARIDKGQVAQLFAQKINADCIIIAGDDRTDESMFERVIDSYSIHVGSQLSAATIHVPNPAALHRLLIDLTT